MAFIRNRPGDKSPWQVNWREEGRQRSKRFRDRKAANQFLAEVERRLQLGAHAPEFASSQTLEEWLTAWIATDGVRWAQTTERQRIYILQRWCTPYVGHVRLRELGVARCKVWRADIMRAGASPRTVNAVSRVLSAALAGAVEDGLIPANPMRAHSLGGLPEAPTDRRAVPLDVVEGIRAQLEHPRDRLIVSLMAYCGLRPAEVLGLRWGDVSDDAVLVARSVQRGRIVTTKTGRVRVIPVIAAVREDFEVMRVREVADVQAQDVLLFPNLSGGPLDWHNWRQRVWAPAGKSLLIRPAPVPYELRHTFASLRIAEGRTVLEVAAWLGHSTPNLTLSRYGHLFSQAQMKPGESMEAAVGRARAHASTSPSR